jgi:hypothetical protein
MVGSLGSMTTKGAVRNSQQGWLEIVSNDNIVK